MDTSASPRTSGPSPHAQPSNDEIIAAMLSGADPRTLGGNNSGTGPTAAAPFHATSRSNRVQPVSVARVDGNTVFGQASLGGSQVDLTVNTLYAMIQGIEAQQAVLLDRSKSRGVIFKDLAFASEAEFDRFYTDANPTGRGLAGLVDLISIWAFTSTEQVSTTDWLQTLHKSMATGFANNVETQYVNSMHNRYPVPFVGSSSVITSTQLLKMFESLATWRGNGIGDGTKERMLQFLRLGVQSHRTYVLDNVPAGTLRDHALKSADYSLDFFQALVGHWDDEINMLLSFGLPEKQVMLLLSNQAIQICDELFELRQHASNVDTSNKTATAARFAWVTLQALARMDEYLKLKFKHHPAITGTFIRFLTRQMAESATAGGLANKVTALEKSVRDLKTKMATLDVVNKVDNKLEAVIRANDLKKKVG